MTGERCRRRSRREVPWRRNASRATPPRRRQVKANAKHSSAGCAAPSLTLRSLRDDCVSSARQVASISIWWAMRPFGRNAHQMDMVSWGHRRAQQSRSAKPPAKRVALTASTAMAERTGLSLGSRRRLNVASIRNCRVSDIDRLFKTELRSPITLA